MTILFECEEQPFKTFEVVGNSETWPVSQLTPGYCQHNQKLQLGCNIQMCTKAYICCVNLCKTTIYIFRYILDCSYKFEQIKHKKLEL